MPSEENSNIDIIEANNSDDIEELQYSSTSVASSSPSPVPPQQSSSSSSSPQQTNEQLYQQLEILLSSGSSSSSSSNDEDETEADEKGGQIENVPFHSERCLVAWILLTRFDQDHLDRVWQNHSKILLDFAKQLLSSSKGGQQQATTQLESSTSDEHGIATTTGSTSDDDLHFLYLRLIAQVSSRLSIYPNEIGEVLFHTWVGACDNSEQGSSFLKVHIDVLTSLDVWMMELTTENPFIAVELRVLERIWNIYLQSTKTATASSSSKQNDDEGTTDPGPSGFKIDESKMLQLTLSSILTDENQNDDYSIKSWNDLVLAIFQSHGHQLMPDSLLPVIIKTLDKTIAPSRIQDTTTTSTSNQNQGRNAWHEWILSLIQTCVTTTATNNNQSSALFLNDPEAVHHLNKILLAHVVDPTMTNTTTTESLRGMAWQTVSAIGENGGWRWSFREDQQNNNDTTLGAGTTICTWVRLASGELHIQLQQELSLYTSSSVPLPSTSPISTTTTTKASSSESNNSSLEATIHSASSILPISHACARILINVVQFCVQLEEEPHRMPISSNSLLHLRQSLEQSLWTLVEYLQHQSQIMQVQTAVNNALFLPISLRLFGSLLMEVDIWDLLQRGSVTSVEGPQQILNALMQALPMENMSSQYALLPGLVHIIGDAESNLEKQQQLQLLWDPYLSEYLISYWKDHKQVIDDSITWACACTELWSDYYYASHNSINTNSENFEKNKRRLIVLLVDWIQTILLLQQRGVNNQAEMLSALSSVLGCYMALCKNRSQPPKQHESRVIVRALQLCEQGQ